MFGKLPTWPSSGLQDPILVSAGLASASLRTCPQRRKGTYPSLSPPDSHAHFLASGQEALHEDKGKSCGTHLRMKGTLSLTTRVESGTTMNQHTVEAHGAAPLSASPAPILGFTRRCLGNQEAENHFSPSHEGRWPSYGQERECSPWSVCSDPLCWRAP